MKWIQNISFAVYFFFNRLNVKELGINTLAVFGALWLVVQILDYFGQEGLSDSIKEARWWLLAIGFIIVVIKSWPKSLFLFKVKNRDVNLSLVIGDIFQTEGAPIIPINNRLDCDNNGLIMSAKSVLRFFVDLAYRSTPNHLNTDIQDVLNDQNYWYRESKIANTLPQEYKVGTVVPIFRNEKQYYLLSNSTLNERGRASTTKEDLLKSLNMLWAYLSSNGKKDKILIPLLGTGRGRIGLTREDVIKEITLSFLAALSQEQGCTLPIRRSHELVER